MFIENTNGATPRLFECFYCNVISIYGVFSKLIDQAFIEVRWFGSKLQVTLVKKAGKVINLTRFLLLIISTFPSPN